MLNHLPNQRIAVYLMLNPWANQRITVYLMLNPAANQRIAIYLILLIRLKKRQLGHLRSTLNEGEK
jgi:hypothetical protein